MFELMCDDQMIAQTGSRLVQFVASAPNHVRAFEKIVLVSQIEFAFPQQTAKREIARFFLHGRAHFRRCLRC